MLSNGKCQAENIEPGGANSINNYQPEPGAHLFITNKGEQGARAGCAPS